MDRFWLMKLSMNGKIQAVSCMLMRCALKAAYGFYFGYLSDLVYDYLFNIQVDIIISEWMGYCLFHEYIYYSG